MLGYTTLQNVSIIWCVDVFAHVVYVWKDVKCRLCIMVYVCLSVFVAYACCGIEFILCICEFVCDVCGALCASSMCVCVCACACVCGSLKAST